MERGLSTREWMTLRTLLRAGTAQTGDQLRRQVAMCRPERFAVMMVDLAGFGLAESSGDADPLDAAYTITEKGKNAAEYGYFDWQPPPITPRKYDKKKKAVGSR